MLILFCVIVYVCVFLLLLFFFFKQKTAYELRISDWSSDVCSSDLRGRTRISRGGRCQSPSSWPTMWRRAAARLPAPPTPHPPRSPFPRCYRAGPRALPYVAPTHQRFRSAPAHPWARNETRLRQRSGLAVSPSTRPYSAPVGLSLLSPPEAPSGEAVQSPDKCWDRCRAPPASRSYRPSTPAAGD